MASINKVILIGNLGKTPELRAAPSGQPVCNMSLATNEAYTDKGGQKHDSVEWHNIVVWGKQAEACAKYLTKGRAVYVEGKLRTRSWDDKESGKKQYKTEVVAAVVQFLGNKDGEARNDDDARDAREAAAELRERLAGRDDGAPPYSDEIPF